MEFLADPNIWIGLLTLVVLEIVLGIDNLVFIAILADKLPPHQRNQARVLGLSLALLMRLVLLASISWIVTLTAPLFTVAGHPFSGRDLILILGGVFLLAKGTMELHERLEGAHKPKEGRVVHAVFWQVIAQIVVLDAVFSLDSVITAVGMVDQLWVMVTAVCLAMLVMVLASKPLMAFVSKHPTVVILCLGFLLMIGFSLVVEGFGFGIPKGYLYAAIGFSVLIEAANQMARRNREKRVTTADLRQRTSDAVLRLLGGRQGEAALSETVDVLAEQTTAGEVFAPQEKDMIRGVLELGQRPVFSIMTSVNEIEWIDLDDEEPMRNARVLTLTHSRVVLASGSLENFLGVALTRDLLEAQVRGQAIDWSKLACQPVVLHESTNVLSVMEHLRSAPAQMAMIVDEHGSLEGIATPTDVFEAIAGEFPDIGDEPSRVEPQGDGSWIVDGFIDIRRLGALIGRDFIDEHERYATLAGYVMTNLGRMPKAGDRFERDGLAMEILSIEGRTVGRVRLREHRTDRYAPEAPAMEERTAVPAAT